MVTFPCGWQAAAVSRWFDVAHFTYIWILDRFAHLDHILLAFIYTIYYVFLTVLSVSDWQFCFNVMQFWIGWSFLMFFLFCF